MDAGARAMQEQLPRATRNPAFGAIVLGFIAFNPAYGTLVFLRYLDRT
jgi:hypothetical protein